MSEKESIVLFNQNHVRRQWNEDREDWYFSIIDIISILTDSNTPKRYWSDLKIKLKKEGSEVYEKIVQLKLLAQDGKKHPTDVGDTETILRIIQTIPSPKAEPFKLWLAQVGRERIDETADPEKAIDRAMQTYLKKGYSKEWINQRLKSIDIRKDLTDEWEERGVKQGFEFAILTDEITKAWTGGLSTKEYKKFKDLKKENLRDNMSNLELVLTMLAEATTAEISKKKLPKNFEQNRQVAKQGGVIAGNTRKEIEEKTGSPVITKKNAKILRSGEKKKFKKIK
jgi:tyrosyl-tRNA synthetase